MLCAPRAAWLHHRELRAHPLPLPFVVRTVSLHKANHCRRVRAMKNLLLLELFSILGAPVKWSMYCHEDGAIRHEAAL